jgi:hypothetical protein
MRWLVLAVLGVAGCSDDMLDDAPHSADVCGAYTEALDVTPLVVTRGEAVDVQIHWQLDRMVAEPAQARLILGSGEEIEVDVPLTFSDVDPTFTFVGTQLNPFGAGAPAGSLVITAVGSSVLCSTPPSATTTISLE